MSKKARLFLALVALGTLTLSSIACNNSDGDNLVETILITCTPTPAIDWEGFESCASYCIRCYENGDKSAGEDCHVCEEHLNLCYSACTELYIVKGD